MRHLAQTSDVQLHIGESILPVGVDGVDGPLRHRDVPE
jgi:hypothetical protein